MRPHILTVCFFLPFLALNVRAASRYVDVNNNAPVPPYTNWASAATIIQDAIDVADAGDQILVADGLYESGGQPVYGALTNRVAVTKPLTVQSVNGPAVTVIQGKQQPGTTYGDSAVRCVYLTNGAALVGFTLTSGATRTAGDWQWDQSGAGVVGESTDAVVSNCVFSGNAAYNSGGGAEFCLLVDCKLTANSADYGGGADSCSLIRCTLQNNHAESDGGGVWGGALDHCTLTGNTAYDMGGGAASADVTNCVLSGNFALYGGGVVDSTLYNCAITGNSASIEGGGANGSDLYNCTVTGNSAPLGGGVEFCGVRNSIVYFNTGPWAPNYYDSGFTYSCTLPMPTEGTVNITADPQLASATHLGPNSPCRGAGSSAYVSGADIDDQPWANPPDIGCDQYLAGTNTGPLSVAIQAAYTNFATRFVAPFTADIGGPVSASRWDFADGTVLSNRAYASHGWAAAGDYPVVLTAFNDSFPAGVSATVMVSVVTAPGHYVDASGTNPVAPYLSWDTAATNIQDAVDAATVTGALVLVTNGVYADGGRAVYGAANRVAVTQPLRVQSVNGAAVTVIEGAHALRCVYLTNDASLAGFTLTNGVAPAPSEYGYEQSGGGAWCESSRATLLRCILAGNVAASEGGGAVGGHLVNCVLAANSADAGGGADSCVLDNCALSRNSAATGGGAHDSVLNNCTVVANTATTGGGAESSSLKNCVVYYNSARSGTNYSSSDLNYCCAWPLPADGVGNIAAEPELASVSHLSTGSPARAAGSAAFVVGEDIDGELWAVPPSIGCDEYYSGAVTGLLSVAVEAGSAYVPKGVPLQLVAHIDGRLSASRWDFADGSVVSNRPNVSHTWTAVGDYPIVLTAFNESSPGGLSATTLVHVVEGMHYVSLASTNPVPPYISWETAATNIQDAVDAAYIGGTVVVSNGVYNTGGRLVHALTTNRVVVAKRVTLQSLNGPDVTVIQGTPFIGPTAVRCLYLNSDAVVVGFTLAGGATVASGEYIIEQSGGGAWCESTAAVLSNCVVVGNSAAWFGGGTYLGTLYNCTITGNASYNNSGGGASRGILYNCLLTGNAAVGQFSDGGGAHQCTLNNCIVSGNSATFAGGGVVGGTLNNCLVVSNSAQYVGGVDMATANNCTIVGNSAYNPAQGWGGGAGNSTLNNCIVFYNTALNGPNHRLTTLNYCCTDPLPDGPGNFTNAPRFVDASSGNLRLQTNSPCINSGNNAYVTTSSDLEGDPRIVFENVDTGAYEFQGVSVNLFTNWLQWYGLPTDGSANLADPDGDGLNNWQEWVAGTNPTNALSALRLLSAALSPPNLTLRWQSVTNRSYFVQRSAVLGPHPTFLTLAFGIPGQPDTTTYADTNAAGPGPFCYRVGVTAGDYEIQSPSSVISYAWLQQYGLPTDGSADYTDADGDGMNNWQEWRAGTIPTDAASALRMLSAAAGASGVAVTWQSVANRSYSVQRATNLAPPAGFLTLQTNVTGNAGTTTYSDTNATGSGPFFYRVGVR